MDKYEEIISNNINNPIGALRGIANLCRLKDGEIAKLEKIVDDLVARIEEINGKGYTDDTSGMNEFKKEEIDRIEAGKAEFVRRMKSPNRGTEPKEGCPYGSIRYGAFDKFRPAGGGEK